MKKYMIFSSDVWQYADEDVRENLLENGIEESEIDEDAMYWERVDMVKFDAENFWESVESVDLGGDVCRIEANLGLWYGHRKAHGVEVTLKAAIQRCIDGMDDFEVYETPYGKLCVVGHHHDGTNYYEIFKTNAKGNRRNVRLRKLLGWI